MKRDRIREMSIEVTVGAFMFMILLALGVFTIILSRENLFQKTYHVDVEFEEIMGIREGDNVYLRGVAVGRVRRIEVEPEAVSLRMSLSRPLNLREDYRIEILPSSVLGGRYIYVYEGSSEAEPLPEDTTIRGVTPVDLIDSATRMVERIRTALEDEGMLADVQNAMRNVSEISAKLAQGEGTVGRLLADDAVYNDIAAVTADLRKASGWLTAGESSISRLLSDEGELHADVAEVVRNLRDASARLNDAESLLGKLLAPDDTLYDDLRATAESLRVATGAIARGEGTIGKLMMDNEMYEEVRLLVNELRATIDDFRETAPISTFTSILFGAF